MSTAVLADGVTRRVIVGTRRPAADSLQRMRNDDFDPADRIRYNIRAFKYVNAFVADLDETEIAQLQSSPEVQYIEIDPIRHALADSITPGQQTTPYGINMVNAPAAWTITRGHSTNSSKPVRVAVVDSGIDYLNPDIAPNFKGGTDIVNGDNDPMDDFLHGTHVAGIIGAADNGLGVVGVAPQVELYGVKVLDACGSGRGSDIIAGIEWVRDQKRQHGGNWIVNLSLGSNDGGPSVTERNEYQAASDDGVLVFAAAGNDFPDVTGLAFPAGYPSVISVGAVDSTRAVANFSQRGAGLKLAAPGVSNLSTLVGEAVRTNDGRLFTGVLPSIVTVAGNTLCPLPAQFSSTAVYCGFGGSASDFPPDVNGKIALISRGNAPGKGTVSVSAGSKVVTGNGTSFLTDLKANDSINFCGVGQFTVNAVTSNTSLQLSAAVPSAVSNSGYIVGVTFATKAKNAKAAGAAGVIIFNHDVCGGTPTDIQPSLTLASLSEIPPFVFISESDGMSLRTTPSASISVAFDNHGWAVLSGTSMACPHAVGVAALAWSVAPSLTNLEIADAMEKTAVDLGDAGTDNTYGFGLVNAKAVVDRVNTGGNASQPEPSTGRAPGRRGH